MKLKNIFTQSKPAKLFMILATAFVLVSAATFWWQYSYATPEKVFDRMIENSLAVKSVTKASTVGNELQTVEQKTIAKIEPPQLLHVMSQITQGTGESASSVTRENLVTLENTYVKLTDIETAETDASGQNYDFSSVLNVWGVTPTTQNDNSLAQLYGQNVAVPFASLPKVDRDEVLALIAEQQVYSVDFSTARRETQSGRSVFVYDVSVKPQGFIAMMKLIGQKVGLVGYDDVNPAAYAELPDVPFTFVVDIKSGDLVSVDYGDGQVERYSAHGLRYVQQPPEDTITMLELQQRLQDVQ